jgi:glycosyltransferase involved in cell wall biosynthesis
MIYLDVTSCCRSSLNTGVQRVVRRLYRHLAQARPVTPLRWDDRAAGFVRLKEEEQRFLTNPFEGAAASANPEKTSWWRKWLRPVQERWQPVELFPLLEILQPGDVLLEPEIFKDRRNDFFSALPTPRSWKLAGLFYDAIALRFPDFNKAKRRQRFEDYLRTLADFDGVLCISDESASDLKKFWLEQGRPGAPIQVEGLGADFSVAGPANAANFAARRLLCVGTLEKRKNHPVLFKACERLWSQGLDFSLVLIGRSESSWGPAMEEEIRLLQERGRRVEWLQHVDDKTLEKEYAACAFTVFPSLVEGFGLPIVESVWHRRPCLCGGQGALGEAAAGGGCLIVDQTDMGGVAEAIQSLLQDETLYQRLYQESGTRSFRSWEQYVQSVSKFILPEV